MFQRRPHDSQPCPFSIRDLLFIHRRIEKETGIRAQSNIRIHQDTLVYHGIYPAENEDENDKDVLVKLMIQGDDARWTQFERESWLYGLFSHDNLIRKEFGKTIYLGRRLKTAKMIVLEYVDGLDLAHLMDQLAYHQQKLSLGCALEITLKVLRGLQEISQLKDRHGNVISVVHADVSPHNILISRKGQVKIIDFGISRIMGTPEQSSSPKSGKVGYMAPEQMLMGKFDHRADLFALGVVLTELVLSRRVTRFESLDRKEMYRLSERYLLEIQSADMDQRLRCILTKALTESPDQRFATARDFAIALEEFGAEANVIFKSMELGDLVDQIMFLQNDKYTRIEDESVESESKIVVNPERKFMTRALPYFVGVMIAVILIIYLKVTSSVPDQVQTQEVEWIPVFEYRISQDVSVPRDFITVYSEVRQRFIQTKSLNFKIENHKTVPKQFGTLFVGASPWAEISVAGYATSKPTPVNLKLSVGTHMVSARYQDENGKWQYVAKSVRISSNIRSKCLVYFEGSKRIECK